MKHFLIITSIVATLIIGLGAFVIVGFMRDRAPAPLSRRSEYALGTQCTITLHPNRVEKHLFSFLVIPYYDAPRDRAPEKALDLAFQRLRSIDRRMSANLPESEISAISAHAGITSVRVSLDTLLILRTALNFAAKTGGVFDPTIGPLVKLWGIGTDAPRVPSDHEIEEAQRLVDWHKLSVDEAESTAYLEAAGMSLDLGAIAKGYAADEAARILAEAGYQRAIIDLGGNIYAMGQKNGKEGWRIGVQSPDASRGAYLGIVEVMQSSVVTSGTYERFFEQGGQRYHHILDPRSGRPAEAGIVSVTIVSPSSMIADGLSTSVFALGVSAGLKLVEDEGAACVIVDEAGMVHVSHALSSSFCLEPGDFSLAVP